MTTSEPVEPGTSEPDSTQSAAHSPGPVGYEEHGYQAHSYEARTPTGQKNWALGFLAYIPIPFLGLLIAAIVMVAVRPSTLRSHDPIASENARRAANWGLTVISVMILCIICFAVLALGFPSTHEGFFPLGVVLIVFFVLAIIHAVLTIAGTVVAGKGRVFKNPIAFPFL